MKIGEQFALARKSRGLTQSEIAKDIASLDHVRQFETGDYDMPLEDLQRLLARLGISLRQFANYCERREFNQNIIPETVLATEIAGDTDKLKSLYRLSATRGNTRTDRLGMMMAATAYADITGIEILPRTQIQQEATDLLDTASWNRADLMTLHVLMNTLDCTRIFVFCREILAGIPAKLRWNFALANDSWYAVIAGCQVLAERHSTLAGALLRNVENGPAIPETMIRNKLYAICVCSMNCLQNGRDTGARTKLTNAIASLRRLGATETMRKVQRGCWQILQIEIAV